MPHKRPPNKSKKQENDLVRLMLVRNFLKKGGFGLDEENEVDLVGGNLAEENVEVIDANTPMTNTNVPMIDAGVMEDQAGGRYHPQIGGEDENDFVQVKAVAAVQKEGRGPDYIFLGGHGSGGGNKAVTEPLLVTQLRELRRTIQRHPVVQLGGSDLHDFLKIHQELGESVAVSRDACGQLTRFAQENILGLTKELKSEISYGKIGHQGLTRSLDLSRVDQFLEKYENFKCLCQSEFQDVYSEISGLRSEMEKDLSQNDFRSNNEKIGSLLGVGKSGLFGFSRGDSGHQIGGASRTEINQLLRSNQRQLDDRGSAMLGSGLVGEFRRLQVEAQNKMSIGLNGGGLTGGGGGFDEQSLFGENVGVLSPAEKEAKFQYMDAKQKLLEKQAELLAIKKEKLTSQQKSLF